MITSNPVLTQRPSTGIQNTINTVCSRVTGSFQNSHVSLKSKISKLKKASSDLDMKSAKQKVELDIRKLGFARNQYLNQSRNSRREDSYSPTNALDPHFKMNVANLKKTKTLNS